MAFLIVTLVTVTSHVSSVPCHFLFSGKVVELLALGLSAGPTLSSFNDIMGNGYSSENRDIY